MLDALVRAYSELNQHERLGKIVSRLDTLGAPTAPPGRTERCKQTSDAVSRPWLRPCSRW